MARDSQGGHIATWDDIRGQRKVRLEQTDWVDANSGRVSRSPAAYILALREYRQQLFDITENFTTPAQVIWPVEPMETEKWTQN